VPETTRRVLSKLMATSVALQLNWSGKGKKTGFSGMDVKNVVFGKISFKFFCSDCVLIPVST